MYGEHLDINTVATATHLDVVPILSHSSAVDSDLYREKLEVDTAAATARQLLLPPETIASKQGIAPHLWSGYEAASADMMM